MQFSERLKVKGRFPAFLRENKRRVKEKGPETTLHFAYKKILLSLQRAIDIYISDKIYLQACYRYLYKR